MKVDGVAYRTIWPTTDDTAVLVIDQSRLPHRFATMRLDDVASAAHAIRDMNVRGAPLIGVTAAYGVALAMRHDPSDEALAVACDLLLAARPTAVNLRWGVDRMRALLAPQPMAARAGVSWREAARIADDDVAMNANIGRHGCDLIRARYAETGRTVDVLTHCNAGWLATVDWGTALAPVYAAYDEGIPVHVWVDETRPRNQGASLTTWELSQHGVPHTLIVDNAGGHLMQHDRVDMVIVGCDRATAHGDVCNKIGTYLKALAARDNGVPFYVGLPTPTIDWTLKDGVAEIPIEEREQDEVTHMTGLCDDGRVRSVRLAPEGSVADNPGFDVTPARLVSGLITERGVFDADPAALQDLRRDLDG